MMGDHPEETAKVYNNLGFTYNSNGEDYDEAIKYFELALEKDPSYSKARVNLVLAYANRGGVDDLSKSHSIAKTLWDQEKDENTVQALLWSKYKKDGAMATVKFVDENKTLIEPFLKENYKLATLLSHLNLEAGKLEEGIDIIEEGLEVIPDDTKLQFQKARALMLKAQKEDVIPRQRDIIPLFKKHDTITRAEKLLRKVKKKILESEKENEIMLEDIDYSLVHVLFWLGKNEEAVKLIEDLKLKTGIGDDAEIKHRLNVLLFGYHIGKKEFETAYGILVNDDFFDVLPYEEKRRVSRAFIASGAPEQALRLLKRVEKIAEEKQDAYFFFDLSAVYVLLDRKNEAMVTAEKSVKLTSTQDTELHKIALSHRNAVLFHYTKPQDGEDSETGRLLSAMTEHQQQYPEDKVITQFKALEDNGELSEEFKEMLLKQKDWYENLKQKFLGEPMPTYILERILRKSYSDLVTQGDFEFQIQFTGVDQPFQNSLKEGLSSSKGLVFDYLSLLDLSKMGLLGYLEGLSKKIWVSESLFEKIQLELIQKETPELRRLWDFLRKSEFIQFIVDGPGMDIFPEVQERYKNVFDEWLLSSISFSKKEKLTFVTNDLRLLLFVRADDISAINILPLINLWREKGLIDKISYSRLIGDLAERFYTFLSFDDEDLYHIVLEDNGKITPRSYHLLMQINNEGSVQGTFFNVFSLFAERLWKSGLLSEEKVDWFSFIVKIILGKITETFKGDLDKDSKERGKEAVSYLAKIAKITAKEASNEELLTILVRINEIFGDDPILNTLKQNVDGVLRESLETD